MTQGVSSPLPPKADCYQLDVNTDNCARTCICEKRCKAQYETCITRENAKFSMNINTVSTQQASWIDEHEK